MRRITIKANGLSYEWSGVVINADGTESPMPHIDFNHGAPSVPYTRPEPFGNMLYNGETIVVQPNGTQTTYPDGCHLVERELGVIESKSKAEYEEFTGRPGSGNEN